MCLISVVLPAPFSPTSPKTHAARHVQAHAVERQRRGRTAATALDTSTTPSTPSSSLMSPPPPSGLASPGPACRISSTTSSTPMPSCRASASRASTRSVTIFSRSRRASGEPAVRDVRPGRPPLLDHPRRLQLAIGPRHRVRVHHQPLRQHPDRRQLLPGRQPPRRHQVLHLVDDLQVDRHAVIGRDVDLHDATSASGTVLY